MGGEGYTNGDFECPACGRCFGTENGMKVHHAKTHGESISGVEAECDQCGERIRVNRHRAERQDRVFCSTECMGAWHSDNWVGEDNPKHDRVEVECDNCGELTETFPHRVEKQDRHFCDRSCHAEWKRGREFPDRWDRAEVDCDWCGETFQKTQSNYELTDSHFCDFDCYLSWHSENMAGEESPRWKGGRPDYGKGWNEPKRRAVRKRDGYKCVDCGLSQESHLDKHGEKLHVHHIRPARTVDSDDDRNDPENLITLCRSCHFGKWEKVPLRPQ